MALEIRKRIVVWYSNSHFQTLQFKFFFMFALFPWTRHHGHEHSWRQYCKHCAVSDVPVDLASQTPARRGHVCQAGIDTLSYIHTYIHSSRR